MCLPNYFGRPLKVTAKMTSIFFVCLKKKVVLGAKKVEKSKNAFRVFSLDKYDHNKEIRYETFWKVLLRFPKLCLFLLGFQLKIKKKRKIFGIANFLWNSKKVVKWEKVIFNHCTLFEHYPKFSTILACLCLVTLCDHKL